MKTTTLILTGLCLALWVASGQNSFANRKAIDCVRAQYSAERGYTFDATYMTASMMDRKVVDIQRAAYWKEQGYTFDPAYMTASMMDRKVVDIQRAAYWKKQGHTFDPTCMTASMMDRAVRTGGVSSQPSTTRVPPAIAQTRPAPSSGTAVPAYPSQCPLRPLTTRRPHEDDYSSESKSDSTVFTAPRIRPVETPKPVIPRRTFVPGYAGSRYDPDSLANPHGAGSPYKADGLMNPYSQYGSRYSNKSWTNPYATDAPKLYNSQGNYKGRLSTNPYDPDSTFNPYGRYGSKYSPDSINNSYGAGNPYLTNPIYVVPSQD